MVKALAVALEVVWLTWLLLRLFLCLISFSFGDLIAASVGVIAKPEIWERDQADGDKFMILASDGVWEFISNQEAVDLVHTVGSRAGPEEAVKALVDESQHKPQHTGNCKASQ